MNMFSAQEELKIMAQEAKLLRGRVKQCLHKRWWTCGCLEGTNVYGMGDGNIQDNGDAGGYNKKI
jgi:hypothetical protein